MGGRRGGKLLEELLSREGRWRRQGGHAEVFRDVVAVPHAEDAVELIGKKEIHRPNSILEGIDGTREMYHFAGANTPKYDAQTTTKGLEDMEDMELVLKREGGRSLDGRRGEPIGGAGGGQSDKYGKVDRG